MDYHTGNDYIRFLTYGEGEPRYHVYSSKPFAPEVPQRLRRNVPDHAREKPAWIAARLAPIRGAPRLTQADCRTRKKGAPEACLNASGAPLERQFSSRPLEILHVLVGQWNDLFGAH